MAYGHSLDLRERVISAWEAGENKSAIARRFILGYATVRRYIERFEETGSCRPKPQAGGAPRRISPRGEECLRGLLAERADYTDEELRQLLAERVGECVSGPTVNRTLHRLGLTRKKKRSAPPSARARTSSG